MSTSDKNIPSSSKAYPEQLFTFEQYLAMEDESEYKNEFDKGKIIQLSGGTYRHSRIAANVINSLQNTLRTNHSTCQVTDSNLKVYVEALDASVYPDIMVLCEAPAFWNDRTDIITNPLVIVEVLSKSTKHYDRGGKFRKYRALPSFREYILVAQDEIDVEAWSLRDNGDWGLQNCTQPEEQLSIPSLNIRISLEDIYYQIDFSARG